MSFYSIGVGALNNAQLGLSTAGHNIANVNTEGYHRQAISLATNVPILTGSGFVGQGAHVDTIRRVYSEFLDGQVLQAQTQGAGLDVYQTQIGQIDNILADPSAGLSPALQDFFKAVNEVATNPQSIPSRQSMISAANAMTTRLQTLDQRFSEIGSGLNSQITSSVTTINSLAQQIASINNQILTQTGSTTQPPNDLLDTRENLISQLNQLVRTTTVRQDNGNYNIFIGNGQPLVIGTETFKLSAVLSPEDQSRVEVGYQAGSATVILPKGSLSGGVLGGLLDFRSGTLDSAQNALGRIAMTIAQDFNELQGLGLDLDGNVGQNFFTSAGPTITSSTLNSFPGGTLTGTVSDASAMTLSDYRIQVTGTGPLIYSITDLTKNTTITGVSAGALASAIPGLNLNMAGSPALGDVFNVQPTRHGAANIALSGTISATTIAAAAPIVVNAATTNTGDARVTDSGISAMPLPALPITLTYNSTTSQFSYGVGPTLVAYTPGTPMTIAGNLQVTLNGTPGDGDVFTIGANVNGVADNRNALRMAKLQTANTMEPGASGALTTSYQGAYSQIVSQVGNKAAEVAVTAQAQKNMLAGAQSSQQALSGVNLDEEAANLLRFQQAYQAAGKMIQIASNMFDVLMSIGR